MTKLAGEQLCRVYHVNHGVDTVALRFFTVYGPRQRPDMAFRRFCEAAAAGGRIELFGDGRQSRDFTYVADVVTAIRAAAEAGVAGRAYNVGGGSPVSVNAALEELASIAGRPLDVRRSGRESGDVLHTAADGARAREELGFAPVTGAGGGPARGVRLGGRARGAVPRARGGQGRLTPGSSTAGVLISGTLISGTLISGVVISGVFMPGSSTLGTVTPGTFTSGTLTSGVRTSGTRTPGTFGTSTPGTIGRSVPGCGAVGRGALPPPPGCVAAGVPPPAAGGAVLPGCVAPGRRVRAGLRRPPLPRRPSELRR